MLLLRNSYKRIQNACYLLGSKLRASNIAGSSQRLIFIFSPPSSSISKGKAAFCGAGFPIKVHRPGPSSPCGAGSALSRRLQGAPGPIVLHSTAVSQPSSTAWEAVLTERREAARGQGGTQLLLQLGLGEDPLLSFLSLADRVLHWHPHAPHLCSSLEK